MVKMFKFPTFEEWTSNGRKFEDGIGAYKCQLKSFCWSRISTTYMFAVALSNTNPSNIYTNKLFCKSFEYIEGNNEEVNVETISNKVQINIVTPDGNFIELA